MAEVTLTNGNFKKEVIESDKTVLIDFWASWCGPCKMVAPIIAEIAEEKADTLKVCKVNVDEEPELANSFNISSIPTLVIMKNGEITNSAVGYMPKESILALL